MGTVFNLSAVPPDFKGHVETIRNECLLNEEEPSPYFRWEHFSRCFPLPPGSTEEDYFSGDHYEHVNEMSGSYYYSDLSPPLKEKVFSFFSSQFKDYLSFQLDSPSLFLPISPIPVGTLVKTGIEKKSDFLHEVFAHSQPEGSFEVFWSRFKILEPEIKEEALADLHGLFGFPTDQLCDELQNLSDWYGFDIGFVINDSAQCVMFAFDEGDPQFFQLGVR